MPDQMTESELINRIELGLQSALGNDGDEVAGSEERALDYFFGRYPLKPADAPNRSGVISKDLEDALDATVAQIMPAFSSTDLGQFEPESQNDEQQVTQESDYINWLLFEKHSGRDIIKTALIDALLQRNCTTKAWIEKKVEVEYLQVSGVTAEQLPEMTTPKNPDEQIDILEYDEQIKVVSGQMGPVQIQVYDLSLRKYKQNKNIRIEPIPPEDRLIASDTKSLNLQESGFFAHKVRMTVSDLKQIGVPEEISKKFEEGGSLRDTREYARNRDSKEDDQYTQGIEETTEKLAYDIFMDVDYDGDGIAERRHILYSNGTVVVNEPYKYTLVAAGACYTVPHRWMGRSLYDKLKDIQEVKTELVRQVLEAGRININQRLAAVIGKVDPDSLLESRTGGVVWMEDLAAVTALPPTTLPPESQWLLEYQDKMRRERGGGAIDQAGQAQAVGGDTAHGLERTVTLMEQLNAEAAREFASSYLRQLYLLLHHLVREAASGDVTYRNKGQWQTVTPSQWPERTRVEINVGMTEGERMRRRVTLEGIYAKQKEAMATGQDGVLVNLDGIYATLADICRASYIDEPEEYWINPASPESQQRQQQNAQQAQQAQQQQQQMQAATLQMQATVAQAEMGKAQAQQAKVQIQGRLDAMKQELDRIQAIADSEDEGKKMTLEVAQMVSDTAKWITELEASTGMAQDAAYAQNLDTARLIQ